MNDLGFDLGKELVKIHNIEKEHKNLLDQFRQSEISGLESAAEQFAMLYTVRREGNTYIEPKPGLLESSPEAQSMVEKLKERYQKINSALDNLAAEHDPKGNDRNFIQGIKRLRESADHRIMMTERGTGVTIVGIPDSFNEEVVQN